MVAAPAYPSHFSKPFTGGYRPSQRTRLVADRFRRIWHMVEEIAQKPGQSRRELSDTFHLSERQVQADLNIIRSDMRLPLVRRQGYRFRGEAPVDSSEGLFDLREAQLLVMILRQAMKDRSIPSDRLGSLLRKLPAMFPPHLVPLVERTLDAVTAPRSGQQHQVFAALADGLLRGAFVKLHYPAGCSDGYGAPIHEPIIRPELLLPYLDSWYVLGFLHQRSRTVVLPLDHVTAVTLSEVPSGH